MEQDECGHPVECVVFNSEIDADECLWCEEVDELKRRIETREDVINAFKKGHLGVSVPIGASLAIFGGVALATVMGGKLSIHPESTVDSIELMMGTVQTHG